MSEFLINRREVEFIMEILFEKKVVVITGAEGAIGNAMANRFAESGAIVAVCDIKNTKKTVEEIYSKGGIAKEFTFDVSDRASVKNAMEQISNTFGGIDVLINNAGINVGPDKRQPIHEFDDEWWDRIVKIDLEGVYNCSKAAIPYMKSREGSNIINISSVVGMVPFRKQCAFAAAKAGVINLSKAMALELADEGIRVNVISPGSIAMDGTKKLWAENSVMEALISHIPQHRQGNSDDIANAAMFLASDKAEYITGTVLNVDGGWICGYSRDF